MVQQSADTSCMKHLIGLNGETCYCLITDHYSGTLYGECFCNKAPPSDFLNHWLVLHGLPADVPDKYVCLDQGGDLGHHEEVVNLFQNAGYFVEPTASSSSHQNGPGGECPHQTIGDTLHAMLGGAELPPKFWLYAFHHWLHLYNVTVHCDQQASPFELCTGTQPDLHLLWVFGCHVYSLPAHPCCPDKLVSDTCAGIFLGFLKTMKNVLYYDTDSEVVKLSQHVAFDEAMNDVDAPSLNACLLCSLDPGMPNVLDLTLSVPNLGRPGDCH